MERQARGTVVIRVPSQHFLPLLDTIQTVFVSPTLPSQHKPAISLNFKECERKKPREAVLFVLFRFLGEACNAEEWVTSQLHPSAFPWEEKNNQVPYLLIIPLLRLTPAFSRVCISEVESKRWWKNWRGWQERTPIVQSVKLHFRRREGEKRKVNGLKHELFPALREDGMQATVSMRRSAVVLSLTCSLALAPQLPKSSYSMFCWVHQCSTCQDPNRKKQDRHSALFNCLGTPWQLKSPYILSISTYGRSERITPPEPQAQAHTLPPLSTLSLWNGTSSLITKPEVSMTMKMDCKAGCCFTINNNLAMRPTQLLVVWQELYPRLGLH